MQRGPSHHPRCNDRERTDPPRPETAKHWEKMPWGRLSRYGTPGNKEQGYLTSGS